MSNSHLSSDPEAMRVREVYAGYDREGCPDSRWAAANPGNAAILAERRRVFREMLFGSGLLPLANRPILEIGCGVGTVLKDLMTLGATNRTLFGVDLRESSIESAKARIPGAHLRVANAQALPFEPASFHLVVAFTVLSSIPDTSIRQQVAREMARVLKPGGAIALYDMRFGNPHNPNLRRVTRTDLSTWFPGYSANRRLLTLLPPLARRLGRATKPLYPLLATMPGLRSHFLAVLMKPREKASS